MVAVKGDNLSILEAEDIDTGDIDGLARGSVRGVGRTGFGGGFKGVGEAIAVLAQGRPWLEKMVLADFNLKRARAVRRR